MPSSPEDYLARVGAVVGDDVSDGKVNLSFGWTNRTEAKAIIACIRQMQAELRMLKRHVAADMASVRSEFLTKQTAVGKSVSNIVADAVLGRRNVGRANAPSATSSDASSSPHSSRTRRPNG